MVMMRSAIRSAESRCAMTNTVRPSRDLRHVLLNNALALVVERACRLIENQDARVGNQRAGNGDALPLAPGQAAAPLTDDRVIALGELENEVMGAGELCCGDDALGRHGRIGESDIVPHRAVEQHVVLKHDADLPTQPGRIDLREIDPVNEHPAALGHIEALDKLGEGALA